MNNTMQFTLGPVQGFVAQARRTKDFWAGSFILSYLTGQAMMAVIRSGGKIIFPAVADVSGISDPLLQAISRQEGVEFTEPFPMIGSLPNRFTAKVPDGFSGADCVEAVNATWRGIADQVWDKYISLVADYGNGTEEIWQRQVSSFWDMSWVMGEQSDLLDRRKNWRSFIPADEPGDKCTLMDNYQELSGYLRKYDRESQKKFWDELGKSVSGVELHTDERLCAIALIKRLFPRIFKQGGISFPSTSYLSAVPWLAGLIKDEGERKKAVTFGKEARQVLKGKEDPLLFFQKDEVGELWEFLSLEGTCYFSSTLGNDNLWDPSTSAHRKQLLKLQRDFKDEPSPFYALLLMDGDRLGALLSGKGDEEKKAISKAVHMFSSQVNNTVKNYNGLTVYAGGDDVLALLPLDQALPAVAQLRKAYEYAFQNCSERENATISAAIVYAHHHAPLKQVIARAHQILDEEAKEKSGRDALAITVWKTGGAVINWAAPWELLEKGGGTVAVDDLIIKLLTALDDSKLTNSWIYNIRKVFQNPLGSDFTVPKDINITKLLIAELMRSREVILTRVQAEDVVNDLLTLCCAQWRDSKKTVRRDDSRFSLDGALLVKFLVTKGARM